MKNKKKRKRKWRLKVLLDRPQSGTCFHQRKMLFKKKKNVFRFLFLFAEIQFVSYFSAIFFFFLFLFFWGGGRYSFGVCVCVNRPKIKRVTHSTFFAWIYDAIYSDADAVARGHAPLRFSFVLFFFLFDRFSRPPGSSPRTEFLSSFFYRVFTEFLPSFRYPTHANDF